MVARKARDLTRRKTALEGMAFPGKLADCSGQELENCEIFLVEGDSAMAPQRMPEMLYSGDPSLRRKNLKRGEGPLRTVSTETRRSNP